MRVLRATALTFLVSAVNACGGGDGPGPGPSDEPVLTSVAVTPDTATLFTVTPGTSVVLSAVARDQDGRTMAGLGPATFSTSDGEVATVGGDGTVTAVAPGTAVITAAVTDGTITESGAASVTVRIPPTFATVRAPALEFEPKVVDVAIGGQVMWTIADVPHDVIFTTPNAPENIQPGTNFSATRTFPTKSVYNYHCLIHSNMSGTVRVH